MTRSLSFVLPLGNIRLSRCERFRANGLALLWAQCGKPYRLLMWCGAAASAQCLCVGIFALHPLRHSYQSYNRVYENASIMRTEPLKILLNFQSALIHTLNHAGTKGTRKKQMAKRKSDNQIPESLRTPATRPDTIKQAELSTLVGLQNAFDDLELNLRLRMDAGTTIEPGPLTLRWDAGVTKDQILELHATTNRHAAGGSFSTIERRPRKQRGAA